MNDSSINYYGTWSLLKKEVLRFIKVYHQTLFSPLVNVLLLLAIFSVAVTSRFQIGEGIPFRRFVAAGLVMMAMMQNAFANSSSSFVMGKVLGPIIDYLIPPLSAGEILFAMVMAAMFRGFLVGAICLIVIAFFVPIAFVHPIHAIFCTFFATMFLSLLGMLCGIVSDSFDHMSAITSYIITPLTFLSGTFYSTNSLPEFWRLTSHFNPFFYMIDGFRYSLIGHNDGNILVGIIVMLSINLILWIIIYNMLEKGYKIKN